MSTTDDAIEAVATDLRRLNNLGAKAAHTIATAAVETLLRHGYISEDPTR